jgi:hypothetical protein
MYDVARLARQAFAAKPPGQQYSNFNISMETQQAIADEIDKSVIDAAYASIISYSEALSGIRAGSSSWSIIRLYYSCFYSIKTLLLIERMIPFNGGDEMILDLQERRFIRGGKSSHDWNWTALKSTRIAMNWFCSQDSQDTYKKLRKYRENVNYTHAFSDPVLHRCLVTNEKNLNRRFRTYRDDVQFFYTYMDDHLAIAYPTRLIVYLASKLASRNLNFDPERASHVKKIWDFSDRCPIL